MRILVALMGLLAVVGTALLLLRAGEAPEAPAPLPPSTVEGDPGAPAWMKLRYGTLTFRLRAPDGSVPPGAQVGYETPRGPRLYYVNPEGVRTLTDVPLGELTLVAQAPGFEPLKRAARLEAGVTEEVLMVLTPAPLGPNR